MYLNCNGRIYKDKIFPNPEAASVSKEIDSQYDYSIDISQICGEEENTINILDDIIFDNTDWGNYYPRYEIIDDGKNVILSPYDFRSIESPGLFRRHKIEKVIKENVRLETELKGLRKAVLFLINKVSEIYKEDLSKSVELESFINNNTYITNIISQFPKEG